MKERRGREGFWHSLFIPSAFSPAFSSCSLTTSFMCCHWGSPSPISWTLTSPSGLLPVLYLVILILTWSSAAWSGVTRQKRDKQQSSPQNPSSRATGWRRQEPIMWNPKHCLIRITFVSQIGYTEWFHWFQFWFNYWKSLTKEIQNINLIKWAFCGFSLFMCASILGWGSLNKHLLYIWMTCEDDGDGHRETPKEKAAWLPGCFGARLGLPLVGSLALWTPAVCCSWSWTSFSSKWSSSLSSVVSSVCVAWVRSNSPFRPSVSNSCWAYRMEKSWSRRSITLRYA